MGHCKIVEIFGYDDRVHYVEIFQKWNNKLGQIYLIDCQKSDKFKKLADQNTFELDFIKCEYSDTWKPLRVCLNYTRERI